MIGYIYFIKNLVNKKMYIGITTHIEKRLYEHFRRLEKNMHSNQHLQAAYIKYGKENFSIDYFKLSVKDKAELRIKEQEAIKFFDTLNSGYNMTSGGEQEINPEKYRFNFEKFCEIKTGGQYLKGNYNLIARAYNCSPTLVRTIVNGMTCILYEERYVFLSDKDKKSFLESFKKRMGENVDTKKVYKMSEEEYYKCICILNELPHLTLCLSEYFKCGKSTL